MSSSDWIIIRTIGENKIHVPNHQPVMVYLIFGCTKMPLAARFTTKSIGSENRKARAAPKKSGWQVSKVGQLKHIVEYSTIAGWWFQPTPLKNDGVRQLGSRHSQLNGKS